MGDISIKVSNVPAVKSALEALKARLGHATSLATYEAGDVLVQKARANFVGAHAPGEWHLGGPKPNIVTGNLMFSILAGPVRNSGYGIYSVTAQPHTIYQSVIEHGRTIYPHGQYLRWVGRRSDGSFGPIFKRSVTVPPYPYMFPAGMEMYSVMTPLYVRYWAEAINA